jgi:hypothetical protein
MAVRTFTKRMVLARRLKTMRADAIGAVPAVSAAAMGTEAGGLVSAERRPADGAEATLIMPAVVFHNLWSFSFEKLVAFL